MTHTRNMRLRTSRRGAIVGPQLLTLFSALHLIAGRTSAQQPEREKRDSVSRAAQALEKVTVTAIRGGNAAPISETTLDRAQIQRRYFGQDVPLVLQSAPSLTSYAETGTYWGYSYIRLRGIDQSRINLTLDGIPLNDPEDQVLYFTDFPDLTNSLQSVQIQRGTGTSSNGTASYGGSINFETLGLATLRPEGNVAVGGGSFGARRASAEYRTGLLPSRFALYTRVSAYDIGGYRYHSGLEGRSFFLSGGWFGDRDIVKLTATAGLFADTLSYLAVPATELKTDRRINPLHPNELDRFGEQLGALSYTRLLGTTSSLSTTLYRISASGNYDVLIDPDLWNFNLDFVWYGATSTWQWNAHGVHLDAGVNANTYARDHFLFIRPDLAHRVYTNTGHKRDASSFAKVSYDLGSVTLFGDAQLRWAEFHYTPDVNADIAASTIDWRFFNPKVGLTWRAAEPLRLYASYGVNGREPARNDMFAGFDNLDTSNVAFVGDFTRVHPERAHDAEAGIEYRASTASFGANLFGMHFTNEILPIGELSYIGTPLRKNVRSSRRSGVEVDASYSGIPRLAFSGNATLMRGRIGEYTDDATGQTYRNVEPLLTPHVLASARAQLALTRTSSFDVEGRYTGASYLRNTSEPQFTLPPALVLDAGLAWRVARDHLELTFRGNNLGNSKRYASGYSDGQQSFFFVLPPRNAMLGARMLF
jgi:iron complex outermembrane recepter protein